MHPKKIFIPTVFVCLLITLFFSFREAPHESKPGTREVSGPVKEIFTGASNDVVFKLKNNPRMYFIEEGMEKGLTLNSLRQQLTGKPVEIFYLNQGTSMVALSKLYHFTKVDMNKSMLYSAVEVTSIRNQ